MEEKSPGQCLQRRNSFWFVILLYTEQLLILCTKGPSARDASLLNPKPRWLSRRFWPAGPCCDTLRVSLFPYTTWCGGNKTQLSHTPAVSSSRHGCCEMVGSLYSQGLIHQHRRQPGPLQKQQHPVFALFIVLCPFTPLKTLICLCVRAHVLMHACSACHTPSVPDKSVFSDHPQKHVPQYY